MIILLFIKIGDCFIRVVHCSIRVIFCNNFFTCKYQAELVSSSITCLFMVQHNNFLASKEVLLILLISENHSNIDIVILLFY